jgi:hypothetical protein
VGEADPLPRVRRPQHVAPRPGPAKLHPEQAEERQTELRPVHFGEVPEEFRRRVEELFEARRKVAEGHRDEVIWHRS